MLVVIPNYVRDRAEKRAKKIREQWPDMDIEPECLTQTIINHMLDGGHESEVDVRPPTASLGEQE